MPSVGQANGKFHCFELTNSDDLISRWHDSIDFMIPEDRPEHAPGAVPDLAGRARGGLEPGGSQLRCGRGEGQDVLHSRHAPRSSSAPALPAAVPPLSRRGVCKDSVSGCF